jgi:HK97 family phage major capsid protein
MDNPVLEAAKTKRTKKQKQLEKLLTTAEAENRSFTEAEALDFQRIGSEISALDERIEAETGIERRLAVAAQANREPLGYAGELVIRAEQLTYAQHSEHSYFRDLASVAARQVSGSPVSGEEADAAERRLKKHHKEIEVEARSNPRVALAMREVRQTPASLREQRVNPNTTAGTGGEFVPPLWLVDQYVPYVRPSRTVANRVTKMPLPPGIDVVNIPKITVGSLTAIQTANAAPVASQDIQTSTVSANVNTISGQEDISLQLLEQSPIAIDGVVFDDLFRDYDQRLDLQVIQGTGVNGQHTGVLTVPGASAPVTNITKAQQVTVSNAGFFSSSTGTAYNSVASAISSISTVRYDSPTAIWVHPRRWYAWKVASDGNSRPLVVDPSFGPWNAAGVDSVSRPVDQGIAGGILGLPLIIDANMPTTMSGTATTGGTADAVVVVKEDDIYLWEGTLRMRALPEILSGTLQIRYQVYAYSAFIPTRFPPAIAQLTGNTGLAAPTF